MTGLLADGALAGGGTPRQFERLEAQFIHWRAVQVSSGVDVHVATEQLIAARGGHDLDGGDEGKLVIEPLPVTK